MDPKEMAERFLEWLQTEEGQAAQREHDARRAEMNQLIEKGRPTDWKKWYEPFTI